MHSRWLVERSVLDSDESGGGEVAVDVVDAGRAVDGWVFPRVETVVADDACEGERAAGTENTSDLGEPWWRVRP